MSGIGFAEIKMEMRGHETQFLSSCGFTSKQLSGKHQGCEGCGGKDRYRSKKDGSYICGGGGSTTGGDWIDNVHHVYGWSHADIRLKAMDYLGLKDMSKKDKEKLKHKRNKELDLSSFKLKVENYNKSKDDDLKFYLDDLIQDIERRGHSKLPCKDEKKLAYKVIKLIVSRYLGLKDVRENFTLEWRKINGASYDNS